MLTLVPASQSCRTVNTAHRIIRRDRTPLGLQGAVKTFPQRRISSEYSAAHLTDNQQIEDPLKALSLPLGMLNLALKEGSPHLPPPLAQKAQHEVGLQYQVGKRVRNQVTEVTGQSVSEESRIQA